MPGEPWAAVFWDLDGTLVDTEPSWQATEYRLAEEYGGTWSEDHARQLVGSDLLDSAHYIRRHLGIDLSPAEIVARMVDDVLADLNLGVLWRPGAREHLLDLHEAGVRMALVTMSYERLLLPILAELPHGLFEVVVAGDHVDRGKPHPEPYLTAAAALGVDPERCLAVEDSETGAASAEAAGCTVLVVPHHGRVAASPRRTRADSLTDLSARRLLGLAGHHVEQLDSLG
jgi:HAD superfamily hydrolase (TIGR01509 family)